jgi:serine/threonine-protein kinase
MQLERADQSMVTLRSGEVLGRYRVGKLLAAGGFAKIYRGYDPVGRRAVALKVPLSRYPTSETVADFRHEARENWKLRHPNVLRVFEFFTVRDFPVLVTPLGRCSLAEQIDSALAPRRALRYGLQLLSALAHAHRHHVLHCDVKPENLVVLPGKRIALTDFGAARRGRRTVRGDGTGTKAYMAPEQAAGRPSARSDVYSAGLVLRDMLSGRDPSPPSPRPASALKTALLEVVARATATDHSLRYRDASEMLTALRRIERRFPPA